MAAKAAHFTTTLHPKPSIFEVIAQESLNATIHPALQKIALFLSSCSPKNFSWLVDYCDEFYLLINGLLQYHYLNKYGGSFSEYFYGLKRILINSYGNQTLSKEQQKLTLMYLVFVPYLRIKIEERLAMYRLELADGVLYDKWEKKLKTTICWIHSLVHVSWNSWYVAQYLRYMSGRSDVQTPILLILGLKLTYADTEEDQVGLWHLLFKNKFSLSKVAVGVLSNSLEIGAFFMQFIQSWQSERSHADFTSLPTPPPPQRDPNGVKYSGLCPICMQRWSVPTVLVVSGYIYCFRCIMGHLHEQLTCPVTKLPASVNDITRLYE